MQLPDAPLPSPERLTLFADVILPVPVAGTFTYRVPHELNQHVVPGARVVVQFGQRRVLTAIVRRVHPNPPKGYQAKYLLELLDEQPVVTDPQLALWDWAADYYLCHLGEVMNVALPAGLKLSSQSRIQLHPDFAAQLANGEAEADLSAKEQRLVDALVNNDALTFDQAADLLALQNISPVLKGLLKRGLILIYEELKDKYKPKTQRHVRLTEALAGNETALAQWLDRLAGQKSRQGQEELLLRYLSKVPLAAPRPVQRAGLPKTALLGPDGSDSSLKTLVKHGLFEEFGVVVPRLISSENSTELNIQLSDYQEKILQNLHQNFNQHNTVLLHGVTGSGKTELYIHLIQQVLDGGQQVLLLLPEIALTTQIVSRLQKVFGSRMGVYHSRFSDNERVEVWRGVLQGRYPLVVGVRSAVWLPFSHLGLVVVDEEHDASYKQYDPAPRYHARDLALVLAQLFQAKVLLGSATPALESYWQANQGRYGLVEATERYNQAALPHIELVDLKLDRALKRMKGDFSPRLLEAIEASLSRREQVILFQNRRGYAPNLQCEACGWVPYCPNCDVSLTFHLHANELRCHYCGYREPPPGQCGKCQSTKLRTQGYGTEKIEDELKLLLPEAAIQRMDLDTTRTKYSYQTIIEEFAARKIDILVGTQMVSKGLDFDHVSLVGVFDVDRLLHFPDFRSHERTFQLITQVSGRAGRKQAAGRVLVQTANPQHPVLERVLAHDYLGFYRAELAERSAHGYPPFTRLVRLTIRGEELGAVQQAAAELASRLRQGLGPARVLGPEAPVVERIRNLYLRDVLVKIERDKIDLKKAKAFIKATMQGLGGSPKFKTLQIIPDVDPV